MRIVMLATALGLMAGGGAMAQTPAEPSAGPGNSFIRIPPPGPPPVARLSWTPIQASGEVRQTLKASGRFGTFLRAVDRAGLKKQLGGAATVLAPPDEAFARLGPPAFDALMKDRKALKRVIGYHLLPVRVDAATARAATASVATLEGAAIAFTTVRDKLGAGDAVIMQADLAAGPGLIHVIDKVLMPPVTPAG